MHADAVDRLALKKGSDFADALRGRLSSAVRFDEDDVGCKWNTIRVLGDEALHVEVQGLLDGGQFLRVAGWLCLCGAKREKESGKPRAERDETGRRAVRSNHGNCTSLGSRIEPYGRANDALKQWVEIMGLFVRKRRSCARFVHSGMSP